MKTSKTQNSAAAENITRKGFITGVGAVIAAALTGRSSARASAIIPPPDVIRQSELQSVFDDLEAIQTKILGFRRRILAGAKVEHGPLSGYFEPCGHRRHLGTEEEEHGPWVDFEGYGLRICSADKVMNPSGYDVPRVEFANAR